MNPFRYVFGTLGYNSQSIPSVSNPFSFGIPNMTLQLLSSIRVANANPSFGRGGMAPPYAPLTSYIPSFIPSSSMPIPKIKFIMGNPPLSFRVPSGGIQFHTMGNPHLRDPFSEGNIYNPHYAATTSMVPIQPFMNKFGGG